GRGRGRFAGGLRALALDVDLALAIFVEAVARADARDAPFELRDVVPIRIDAIGELCRSLREQHREVFGEEREVMRLGPRIELERPMMEERRVVIARGARDRLTQSQVLQLVAEQVGEVDLDFDLAIEAVSRVALANCVVLTGIAVTAGMTAARIGVEAP